MILLNVGDYEVMLNTQNSSSNRSRIVAVEGKIDDLNAYPSNSILLRSVTIDGMRNPRGDENKIDQIFLKIKKGLDKETAQVTLEGRDLIIQTGQ